MTSPPPPTPTSRCCLKAPSLCQRRRFELGQPDHPGLSRVPLRHRFSRQPARRLQPASNTSFRPMSCTLKSTFSTTTSHNTERPQPAPGNEEAFRLASQLHEKFAWRMLPGGKLNLDDFLHSERSWEIICDTYRASAPTPPSSTTSGPCASCTAAVDAGQCGQNLIPVRACTAYRPAMPAFLARCCTRPAARR
jgi:hypothetical protein